MTCIFCNIIERLIPAHILFENDEILAFNDVNPQAPTHVLVIPKKHIASINDASNSDENLLGRMLLTAKTIAATLGIGEEGYRLVFNTNSNGGQTVHHIHLHILGGRQMTWPPG